MNFNPIAVRKAKIVCNFGLSECSRVKLLRKKAVANLLQGLTNQKKFHLPTGQVKKKITCPVEKLACPDFFFQK